jgi:hypothetical protein
VSFTGAGSQCLGDLDSRLLVASPPVWDLLLFAKHLFIAANGGKLPLPGGSMMCNSTASALNSEQDLASIPMAGGGLSRLAIARLKSAGVPVAPLLKRVGLTPELIAEPQERLSVRSQIALLDEAAASRTHFLACESKAATDSASRGS